MIKKYLLPILFCSFISLFGNPKYLKSIASQTGIEDGICSICGESNLNTNKPIILLSCEHRFHAGCVAEWLRYGKNCPNCRREVDEESMLGFTITQREKDEEYVQSSRASWRSGCCSGLACGMSTVLLFLLFGA